MSEPLRTILDFQEVENLVSLIEYLSPQGIALTHFFLNNSSASCRLRSIVVTSLAGCSKTLTFCMIQ